MDHDFVEPFMKAFHADDANQVRGLLTSHPELKAMINEPLGPFDSPLIGNVRSRPMLDVLLEAGADLNAKSRWWAGGFGLLDRAQPRAGRLCDRTGRCRGRARGGPSGHDRPTPRIDRARFWITVHARGGETGRHRLHCAGSVEVATYLLDQSALIDARDVDHESTPAQYMVGDRQEVARFLVTRGCQSDILMASALGDINLVKTHLDRDPECIRMRVSDEFFPKIDQRSGGTIYGWTLGFFLSAHQVARKFSHEDVLQLLFDRSPGPVKLVAACWLGNAAMVHALEAEHANLSLSFTDSDRRQVAHAARNNESTVVRLMLECGLPVNAQGQHQATPLHWAAFHGNVEMAKVVLRYGPPLEATDADFNGTPLGWAIHGSENGWNCQTGDYAGTVELLIAAGAKVPCRLIGGSEAVRDVLRRHGATEKPL